MDEPIDSSEALINQWLRIFELINESDVESESWRIRWLLPDDSVTSLNVNRADYQGFQAGELDALDFLASIEVEHQP